jgi:hypothetical protein
MIDALKTLGRRCAVSCRLLDPVQPFQSAPVAWSEVMGTEFRAEVVA